MTTLKRLVSPEEISAARDLEKSVLAVDPGQGDFFYCGIYDGGRLVGEIRLHRRPKTEHPVSVQSIVIDQSVESAGEYYYVDLDECDMGLEFLPD